MNASNASFIVKSPTCAGDKCAEQINDTRQEYVARCKALGYSPFVVALFRVLIGSGCRASSLRLCVPENITREGVLILPQGKGSNPLVFTDWEYSEFWRNVRNTGNRDAELYNYKFWYRLCDRVGCVLRERGRAHRSVTHTARKLKARDIYEQTQSLDAVASALGHRSTKSSAFYIEKEPTKMKAPLGVLNTPRGEIRELRANKKGVLWWQEKKNKKK